MKTQEATTTTTKKPAKAKAPKGADKPGPNAAKTTKAKPKAKENRAGSKTAIILDLLRRKEGASIAEIAKATDWLNHSIRGFLSGQVGQKMGLKLESDKVDGERRYRLASPRFRTRAPQAALPGRLSCLGLYRATLAHGRNGPETPPGFLRLPCRATSRLMLQIHSSFSMV